MLMVILKSVQFLWKAVSVHIKSCDKKKKNCPVLWPNIFIILRESLNEIILKEIYWCESTKSSRDSDSGFKISHII